MKINPLIKGLLWAILVLCIFLGVYMFMFMELRPEKSQSFSGIYNNLITKPKLEQFASGSKAAIDTNNHIIFDFYSRFRSKEGNIFYSPLSILSVVAMAYEGSEGKTAEEISSAFHLPQGASLKGAILNTLKILKLNNIYIANSVLIGKEISILPLYSATIQKYYLGYISGSPEELNKWVSKTTHNNITIVLSKEDPIEPNSMLLVNAIYYKGEWLNIFEKIHTQDDYFHLTPKTTIKSPIMHQEISAATAAGINYAETNEIQLIELPYKNSTVSMLILLPKFKSANDKTYYMTELEEQLNTDNLAEWIKTLAKTSVKIYLPRFRFESTYQLKDDLIKMGVVNAFNPTASFSGIANGPLFISSIMHKAMIDCDEEGTTAKAVTIAKGFTAGPIQYEEWREFKADHPFIFIIRENLTNAILFIGRVNDPR